MDLQLTQKNALITGASQGLGFAVARGLCQAGARVALNSRDPKKLSAAASDLEGDVIQIPGDLTHPGFTDALVEEAASGLGGLDLLVTNAGGPPAGGFEDFDEGQWQEAVDLSFLSHVRLIQAALPHLKRGQSPAVLAITSITVKQPLPGLILSNSVRMATAGLIKSLAHELGPDGIRFNAILPGWTMTERVANLMTYRAQTNQTTPEIELKKQAASIPLGRMGTTEEFANAAVFLLSPAASYITGVMLLVDGGLYGGSL